MRAPLLFVVLTLAVAPCHAGKPIARDGSTIEKAIPLKQRGTKAIDEEMAWMMKILRYTPLLATRDIMLKALSEAKATKRSVRPPTPWEHATLEHAGRWCSYWMVRTPRGKRHIYFDTGISVNTPGAVPQIESSRAQYMGQRLKGLKLQ
jgi:hypothetical protein